MALGISHYETGVRVRIEDTHLTRAEQDDLFDSVHPGMAYIINGLIDAGLINKIGTWAITTSQGNNSVCVRAQFEI